MRWRREGRAALKAAGRRIIWVVSLPVQVFCGLGCWDPCLLTSPVLDIWIHNFYLLLLPYVDLSKHFLLSRVSESARQIPHCQRNSGGEQGVLPQNERRLLQIPVGSGLRGRKEGWARYSDAWLGPGHLGNQTDVHCSGVHFSFLMNRNVPKYCTDAVVELY